MTNIVFSTMPIFFNLSPLPSLTLSLISKRLTTINNATFITLVPKKRMTSKISDFRPISLVTSLYKIIAKVLSGRLRRVLNETMSPSQGALVEGRQILDAMLIANEVVDEKKRS